jgi:hypothetical protein
MGLDLVELVLSVEKSFQIDIPDEDAPHLETPRQLVDYVAGRLQAETAGVCLSQRAFYRVRRALLAMDPPTESRWRPESRLLPAFPNRGREARWLELEERLALSIPDLRRPVALSLFGVALVAVTASYSYAVGGGLNALLLGAMAASAFVLVTRPFKIALPFDTAEALSKHIAVHHAQVLKPASSRWSYGQVEEVVFGLVRDSTGLSHFDPDAHFVRDLNLD